jgi:2-amino-4-hydroxy-6-hydroxymethyldihydropteridine diphosphokinase
LAEEFSAVAVSDLFQTTAIGPAAQPDYVNAAIRFATDQPPRTVLDRLLAIEQELGRTRTERWAARAADLDLLLYGQAVLQLSESDGSSVVLEIPHPRMSFRHFVLQPACQIAANWRHPVCGATLQELLAILTTRRDVVAVADTSVWSVLRELPTVGGDRTRRGLPGGVEVFLLGHWPAPVLELGALQYQLEAVADLESWSAIAREAKLLVLGPAPTLTPSDVIAVWKGPRLELKAHQPEEAWTTELAAALAATSPDSIVARHGFN